MYDWSVSQAMRVLVTWVTRVIGLLPLCYGALVAIVGMGPGGAVGGDGRLFALPILLYGILCMLPDAIFRSRIVSVVYVVLTILPTVALVHSLVFASHAGGTTEMDSQVAWLLIVATLFSPLRAMLVSLMPPTKRVDRRRS